MGEIKTKRTPSVGGVIINVVAIVAAIAAFPYLIVPLLELGFVGLVGGAPLLFVGYLIGFVVIDIGPIVGLITSAVGVARWLGWVTGALSLLFLTVMIIAVAALKTELNLGLSDGKSTGPRPANCAPKTEDASAIGRPCSPDAGAGVAGSCPPGYWCFERFPGSETDRSSECKIQCYHDCECPTRHACKYDWCAK
jgi:hypothetical protein